MTWFVLGMNIVKVCSMTDHDNCRHHPDFLLTHNPISPKSGSMNPKWEGDASLEAYIGQVVGGGVKTILKPTEITSEHSKTMQYFSPLSLSGKYFQCLIRSAPLILCITLLEHGGSGAHITSTRVPNTTLVHRRARLPNSNSLDKRTEHKTLRCSTTISCLEYILTSNLLKCGEQNYFF